MSVARNGQPVYKVFEVSQKSFVAQRCAPSAGRLVDSVDAALGGHLPHSRAPVKQAGTSLDLVLFKNALTSS
jgi:hypothetical protein